MAKASVPCLLCRRPTIPKHDRFLRVYGPDRKFVKATGYACAHCALKKFKGNRGIVVPNPEVPK